MLYEQRKRALHYLMFLKEKRDGTIKARGCTDSRSQQYLGMTLDYMCKNKV